MAIHFFTRWGFAGLLIALTYNPTPFNYLAWFGRNHLDQLPLAAVLGVMLAAGYVVSLRATLRALGLFGVMIVLFFVGALVWLGLDYGILHVDTKDGASWLAIFTASLVLGTGLSWSIIRRQLSGQVDVLGED
ncbi:DUF6524 family protein [Pseudoroseicyclus sp. H15]